MIDDHFRFIAYGSRTEAPKAFQFDPADLSFKEIPGTYTWPAYEPGPLYAAQGRGMALFSTEKSGVPVESWWLAGQSESKYPAALIAAKADFAEFSLATLNVWYADNGNLFVRRLKKVTQDEVDDLLECEERTQLLSDAKQIGTGIMIFLTDNDDRFPPAVGWRDKVYPYIKNNKLLDGFVYSYKGPANAVEVADPSNTELGYKEGLFGRAVARTDSSAIWVSRRKRPPVNCEP